MDNKPNEQFTMFGHGYINRKGVAVLASRPKMTVDIGYVYKYIREGWAREQTAKLVEMLTTTDNDAQQEFKKLNFETVTFTGRFKYRNAKSLIARSPFMPFDVDHLGSTERAREVQRKLIADPRVETALSFLSPRAEGVKHIIRIPEWLEGLPYKVQFARMCRYMAFEHGIAVDPGSDVCRACYLPFDPLCYVNEKYISDSPNI